jgi:hypothetical protein
MQDTSRYRTWDQFLYAVLAAVATSLALPWLHKIKKPINHNNNLIMSPQSNEDTNELPYGDSRDSENYHEDDEAFDERHKKVINDTMNLGPRMADAFLERGRGGRANQKAEIGQRRGCNYIQQGPRKYDSLHYRVGQTKTEQYCHHR